MRRTLLAASFLLLLACLGSAYPVYYKEQFYKLYHEHYIQYPDDAIENIWYLEQAKKANFCNPLYAMAKIEDTKDWDRYRLLLDMEIDLKLIEQHLALALQYDKRVAYFYNAPWKADNLESLKIAESAYRAALAYWPEAKDLALKAMKTRFNDIEGAEYWIDQAARIETGDLDFGDAIGRELARLARVRADFEKMDKASY
jgi:hypothetical protein